MNRPWEPLMTKLISSGGESFSKSLIFVPRNGGWRGHIYNQIHCSSWIVKGYGIIWRWEFDCSLSKRRHCVQSRNLDLIWHSRIIFFKKHLNYLRKFSRKIFENVKENVPSNPLLKFVHNFWLETWNVKRILGYKIYLNFPTFLNPTFLETHYSNMPKWGLKL